MVEAGGVLERSIGDALSFSLKEINLFIIIIIIITMKQQYSHMYISKHE
jgi:hypothetical protein